MKYNLFNKLIFLSVNRRFQDPLNPHL